MSLQNEYFVERAECPGCLGGNSCTIFECEFCTDPIGQYLKDFYDPQGGVEFEFLEGASFALRQCRNCSLIFQGQIGNDFLLKKLYEEWIDPALAKQRDDQRRDLPSHTGDAKEIITVLQESGKMPAETKFFDFGMGWGRWAQMARAFDCQAFGLELSEERTKHARSQGIVIAAWDDIPGSEFDLINTEQVFEHIPQPLATLQHLAEGLAPTGLLKISVPNGAQIPWLLKTPDWKATSQRKGRRPLNAVAPLEHINCFNQKALFQLGRNAGLEPVRMASKTDIRVKSKNGRNWLRSIRAQVEQAGRAAKRLYFGETYHFFRRAR